MKTIRCFLAAACGLALVTSLPAAQTNASLPLLKTKVRQAAVFKNGLGFVFKSGETPLQDGWVVLSELPNASLGSLWIGTTSREHPVTEVIAQKDKVSEEVEAVSLAELLAANAGRQVTLTVQAGQGIRTLSGELLPVPADRKLDETGEGTPRAPVYSSWAPPTAKVADMVLLRLQSGAGAPGIVAVNKSLIQSVELAGGDAGKLEFKTKTEKEVRRARVHVKGDPKSSEITLGCLEKGLVWSPSYRVDIAKTNTALITLQALLACDSEELDNAEVSFAVGYPNFLFAEVLSPLSLRQDVAAFIQSLASGGRDSSQDRNRNVMSQSVMFNTANFDSSSRGDAGYAALPAMPGEGSEDLFFYRKEGVTLKRGERAAFTVLEASVPCEHLYEWEIPDSMNVDDSGRRRGGASETEAEQRVWHVLRLENASKQPWTTAPAFTMNGSKPLAQDVLRYTPPGARNTLKLTVATDVRAEQTQTETARKIVNLASRSYDEVTVAGTLKVTNRKADEIGLVVRKTLVGEVLESPDGKVSKVARQITAVNPNCEVTWEFRLPAGKERTLNYRYKVLIGR